MLESSLRDRLRHIAVFEGAAGEQLDALAGRAVLRRFLPGEIIFTEGSRRPGCGFWAAAA